MPSETDIIEAIRHCFHRVQGHCPTDHYEDGYSDAIADAETAVKLLYRVPESDSDMLALLTRRKP